MKLFHILLKLVDHFVCDGRQVFLGLLFVLAICLDALGKGIPNELLTDFIRDAWMDKGDHCSLIFIPEHHMDVGMTLFVMVGSHPLQILHPDSIELCQGQNVAVDIVLPRLMIGQPQFGCCFRRKGNDPAIHIDTAIGQLPNQSGGFLPGIKLFDRPRLQFTEQSVAHSFILHGAGSSCNVADMCIVAFWRFLIVGVPVALLINQNQHGNLLAQHGWLSAFLRHP